MTIKQPSIYHDRRLLFLISIIMETKEVKIKDIVIGEWYHLSGDIQNGNFITHEEVSRRITRIADNLIHCECGRKFIINNKLKITKLPWM